jgi:uncharacterized protein (DUF924 family)
MFAVVLQYITEQFAADIKTLAAGGYDDWMQQPMAAVAGIVLADQFTRYISTGCTPLLHVAIETTATCPSFLHCACHCWL